MDRLQQNPKAPCIHAMLGLACDASNEIVDETISMRLREFDEYYERSRYDEVIRTAHLRFVVVANLWKEGLCRPCVSKPTAAETPAPEIVTRKRKAPYDLSDAVPEPSGDTVTLEDFDEVVLDSDNIPTQTFACLQRHSFYRALHADDPSAFPLSSRVFANRKKLFEHGVSLQMSPWEFNKSLPFWLHNDPTTKRKCVHAIFIKEKYEPRWGRYLCLEESVSIAAMEWKDDLQTHPVSVFIDNVRKNELRYCGHWNFERITDPRSTRSFDYVKGSTVRRRNIVFRVSLASYDDRWGPNQVA